MPPRLLTRGIRWRADAAGSEAQSDTGPSNAPWSRMPNRVPSNAVNLMHCIDHASTEGAAGNEAELLARAATGPCAAVRRIGLRLFHLAIVTRRPPWVTPLPPGVMLVLPAHPQRAPMPAHPSPLVPRLCFRHPHGGRVRPHGRPSRGPAQGFLSLAFYDQAGTLVRSLLSAEAVTAGAGTVTWDATSDLGVAVPVGTYSAKGVFFTEPPSLS